MPGRDEPPHPTIPGRSRCRRALCREPDGTLAMATLETRRNLLRLAQGFGHYQASRMPADNLTWGEERIAEELWLKLHIRLSPRMVGQYRKRLPCPRGPNDQRESTFLHHRAHGILAWDFFASLTVGFRILLCIGRTRDRLQAASSRQRHPTSDCGVDHRTVPGSKARGSALPVSAA